MVLFLRNKAVPNPSQLECVNEPMLASLTIPNQDLSTTSLRFHVHYNQRSVRTTCWHVDLTDLDTVFLIVLHDDHLKTIRARRRVLAKNPIVFEATPRRSLIPIARRRKRNNPAQTRRTMLIGGITVSYPRAALIVVGRVAEWIRTMPIQPAASLGLIQILITPPECRPHNHLPDQPP